MKKYHDKYVNSELHEKNQNCENVDVACHLI